MIRATPIWFGVSDSTRLATPPVDHTAHRYWRVFVDSVLFENPASAGAYVGFNYIGMAEIEGGPDLINPLLVSTNGSGSSFQSSEPATNAFLGPNDNNKGVVVGDEFGQHWFQWDFGPGNAYNINELRIAPRFGYPAQQATKFRLAYSDDGTSWTTKFTEDRTGDPLFRWIYARPFSFTGVPKPADPGRSSPHKFWRVRTTSFFDSSFISLTTLKFFTDTGMVTAIPTTGAEFFRTGTSPEEGSASSAFSGGRITGSHDNIPYVVGVKYTTAVTVVGFSMISRSAYGQAPKKMYIDYSDDGQNWYLAWEIPEQPAWAYSEHRSFADPAFL